ncbi:LysR family transcriptional regulator [Stella sp.]|uniref:LysR family transcriptional regulator n=1 Tax=Stella sp. TaxID=2912054 RepID=UPI0035AE2098
MRRLPPFPALVAFEAVARLGSFTRAAAELHLTQSAVSHRIRALEAHFGTRLVDRRNPGLCLTAAGEAVLPDLVAALDLLARVGRTDGPRRLRLGAGSALATWWLARRLPAFAAAMPGIAVDLVPYANAAEAQRLPVDVTIRWVPAAEAFATATQRPLPREQVFPVCHPSLLPAGRPFAVPDDLRSLPLLHKGPGGEDAPPGPEWSWSAWLDPSRPPPRPAFRFRDIGQALAAAADAAGVTLARTLLVRDAIADGRLARALPPSCDRPSAKVHVIRWPAALAGDRAVARLSEWLATAAAVAAPGAWPAAQARQT